jgi:ABC-type nitrate/sulfonate/bicarbonate transport system substrate-binding protein
MFTRNPLSLASGQSADTSERGTSVSMARNTSAPVSAGFDRRRFLIRGLQAGGLAAVAGPVLAACSSSSSSSTASSSASASSAAVADLGALSYRLSWIKNAEFAGSYIADTKGYYKAEGFSSVNLIAGGASATPMEADVATGKALFGVSSPDITGAAILKGAPLKIIGGQYQKNPFAIMSMAKTPIKTAKDMYGKKIGVQVANTSVWDAFIKAAGLDASKIKVVPVQFDPLPLTQGTVDGWFSFITNEPNELRSKGFDVTTFLLADQGYPLVSETYFTTTQTISSKPDVVKAFLTAEIKGWKDNIADPALGAQLTVDVYGKGLGLTIPEQTLESKSESELILTPDTQTNGLFTVTPALIEANLKTLAIGGLKLTADQLFDLSILKGIYKDNPSLV